MYKCKECGARLDPCEKCDCVIQKQMLETIKNEIEILKLGATGGEK